MPVDWFALCSGAKIAMDSGTENMDWCARSIRRIVEFTQAGGEINVVVYGINVGAQSYWNAEATMLMHTRGILIMTGDGAMVLTGKRALDYSGGVSAEDNLGIGGYERIMGPNGQAQYWAADLTDACRSCCATTSTPTSRPASACRAAPRPAIRSTATSARAEHGPHRRHRLRHHRRRPVAGAQPGPQEALRHPALHVGGHRPGPRAAGALARTCATPSRRWSGTPTSAAMPVCLIGIECRPLPRFGFAPADGPDHWTPGTLFPLSSKKVARAINSASGNRPVVVLANLSGFDGSPESMRALQLEYGAEIGRAVVNFRGPFVFCVISRYHGGAYVVFSKVLNERVEAAALEGSYASVIGGAPAAAVVFAGEVEAAHAHAIRAWRALDASASPPPSSPSAAACAAEREALYEAVHAEKLGETADQFDHVHSVQRAQQTGAARPHHHRAAAAPVPDRRARAGHAAGRDPGVRSPDLQRNYDQQRTRYLERQGLRVLRFTNLEVLQQLDAVLTMIHEAIDAGRNPP